MLVVAHDHRRREAGAHGARRRLLQKRLVRHQRPELLWKALARTGQSRVPDPPDRITGTMSDDPVIDFPKSTVTP